MDTPQKEETKIVSADKLARRMTRQLPRLTQNPDACYDVQISAMLAPP